MASPLSFGGKRELLARGLLWSGTSFILSRLPAKDSLLVLNYHRIGNPDDDLFDPGVFEATADQFNDQISYLKRLVSPVTLEEALSFIDGTTNANGRRCRVLITFDDGYLDNYQIAFPILRSHDVQGVFFLVTSMVGSCHLPWWDQIAYLVKTGRKRQFSLRYPADLAVDIDMDGFAESLRAILKLFKSPENSDSVRFIRELQEGTQGDSSPETQRRFLNWEEAREMLRGGMAIGSHTHSHQVLSQLEPSHQREELMKSRSILKDQLSIDADVLAYPVGGKPSFTRETEEIARDVGYHAAFSYYGGTNMRGKTSPYDVHRIGIGDQSWNRFRVQSVVCRSTGGFWP
jgi:peptidoglycan/xylan/chitin deacetylase (PgdA/CDA1 family)